jgi:carbon monoxide dehydrogenase subunit G
MEFSGTFELQETTGEEVWLALSDPVLIEQSLPGCQFLLEVKDEDVDFEALRERSADRTVELSGDPEVIADRAFEEGSTYAAVLEIDVGPVNPTFEAVGTIEHREYPEMSAVGHGGSGDSSFEVSAGMALSETDDGVTVEWESEADVFGRLARMGQRVINPAANQVVKRFFTSIQNQLHDLAIQEESAADAGDSSPGDETQPAGEGATDQGWLARLLSRLRGR